MLREETATLKFSSSVTTKLKPATTWSPVSDVVREGGVAGDTVRCTVCHCHVTIM